MYETTTDFTGIPFFVRNKRTTFDLHERINTFFEQDSIPWSPAHELNTLSQRKLTHWDLLICIYVTYTKN